MGKRPVKATGPGRHQRLGDAILAAQAANADTGRFPELLSISHLLMDNRLWTTACISP